MLETLSNKKKMHEPKNKQKDIMRIDTSELANVFGLIR